MTEGRPVPRKMGFLWIELWQMEACLGGGTLGANWIALGLLSVAQGVFLPAFSQFSPSVITVYNSYQ